MRISKMHNMTLAEKYNAKCREIMPQHVGLLVDPMIDDKSEIDDTIYRASEYLGGMCAVILELVE